MSKIEWTETTWNPIAGCTKVSPGCAHCYAEKMARRLANIDSTREKYGSTINDRGNWSGVIKLDENTLLAPLKWEKPRMVFVNSMSDLFHPGVPDEFVDRVFAVMAACRHHTFQVLTKRPERMASYLQSRRSSASFWAPHIKDLGIATEFEGIPLIPFPLKNVWIGPSVEDQKTADERIPHILQCPAAVRFLSCEPLLGDVFLRMMAYAHPGMSPIGLGPNHGIDWVIVGGESGPNARPMHPDWARSIRDQCVEAGVPFFFKQWGEYLGCEYHPGDGQYWRSCADGRDVFDEFDHRPKHTWPRSGNSPYEFSVRSIRIGKKSAGRLLDGRAWDQFPEVSSCRKR